MGPDIDITAAAKSIRRLLGLDQLAADLAKRGVGLAAYLRWPAPPAAPAGKPRPSWQPRVINGGRGE